MTLRGVGVVLIASLLTAFSGGAYSAQATGNAQRSGSANSAAAATSAAEATSQTAVGASASAALSPGAFVPLRPTRILDTRYKNGASGPVAALGTAHVQVTGRGGVPTSGVSAVVVNVTATSAKAGGYVTVYPTGKSRPRASNVNFGANRTVPNLVTVRVGSNGKVSLYNGSRMPVQLIGDVAGYYKSGTVKAAGMFVSLNPARVLDTRYKNGASGPVAARRTVHLQVTGRGGVPSSGVAAVVMNVTVTSAKGSGYVTVFPDGKARPTASNVNFGGRTVANLVTVRLGAKGKVSLYNGSDKSVELIADVAGYYRSGTATAPGAFVSLNPTRVLDTRYRNGATGPVASKRTVHLVTAGRGGVSKTGVSSVVMNVTVTSAKGSGYVTVFPDGTTRPTASNLNFGRSQTLANLANAKLGKNGRLSLYNSSSTTMQLVADVSGYFLAGSPNATAKSISAGSMFTCAVTNAGGAKCWGWNGYGQLGNGTKTDSLKPVGVAGLSSGVKEIAAGGNHACALTTAGGVKCWGANEYGQLGNGTTNPFTNPVLRPVSVSGLSSGVLAISAAAYHTCALTSGGAVKCWGKNDVGQLGTGSYRGSTVPVTVSGLSSGAKAVAIGGLSSCALTIAGAAKCWGGNGYGQLGNGSTKNSSTPVNVSGLSSGVRAIRITENTCAVTASAGVKCWGWNDDGQLGNGSRTNSSTPVNVSGVSSGATGVEAGGDMGCAIVNSSGAVRCWGYNYDGKLGNGTTTSSSTPVSVSQLGEGSIMVTAGGLHACSVGSVGTVKCWGANYLGQLGDGTTTKSPLPKRVLGF